MIWDSSVALFEFCIKAGGWAMVSNIWPSLLWSLGTVQWLRMGTRWWTICPRLLGGTSSTPKARGANILSKLHFSMWLPTSPGAWWHGRLSRRVWKHSLTFQSPVCLFYFSLPVFGPKRSHHRAQVWCWWYSDVDVVQEMTALFLEHIWLTVNWI